MAYLASTLITRAWNLSGIVPRGLNVVSGDRMSLGLQLLNELLAMKSIDEGLIPYFKPYSFDATEGVDTFFIPNLLIPETLTFTIGTVRYAIAYTNRVDFEGTARANNITSLPFQWNVERAKGGSNIRLYFVPNVEYPMIVWGKFGLEELSGEDEDLQETYDNFYIGYLRYALAQYMCQEFNITFLPQNLENLKQIEQKLKNISPPDLSMKKISTLSGSNYINYGVVNLSNGWTVPT